MSARIFQRHFPVAVLAILPFIGLLAGPAYAPIVFGLGIAQLFLYAASRGRLPRIDPALSAVAILFAGLCWASASWSIVPEMSLRGSLQTTGVLLAAMIFLAQEPFPDEATGKLMRAMAVAFLVGGVAIALDTAAGFSIQSLLSGNTSAAATKYNRGTIHAVIIVWPILGYLWQFRAFRFLNALLLGLAMTVVIGMALIAKLALVVGIIVLALSWISLRATRAMLSAGVTLLVATLPWLLSTITNHRDVLSPYLKQSGQHRLEIWNYMTARALERPVAGWGFWSASSVPIDPQEMSAYTWVSPQGIYPHNQWLQLWLETGAIGAALGIGFLLVVLKRVRNLPRGLQPFAHASFAAAMTVSMLDFDLAVDSWWAALAVCGFLFRLAAVAGTDRGGGFLSMPRERD